MPAIHIRMPALTIRAGRRALERVRDGGLRPEDVHVIPGAAGGPKALGISGLDQAVFGEWLMRAPQERALIGSSIGSWRFAAVASSDDPATQLAKLADLYTSQRFSKGVSPAEVTRKSTRFLEELIGGRGQAILEHPWYRLNIVVVRSLAALEDDARGRLGLGLMRAISANMVSRRHLGRFFERGIIHDQRLPTPLAKLVDFPSHQVPLSQENLVPALLASASIPLVMSGVRNIPGAPEGVYRDGGLLDYHLDLPYQQPGVVLYPHLRIGWYPAGSTRRCPGVAVMWAGCRMWCWWHLPGRIWNPCRIGSCRTGRTSSATLVMTPAGNAAGAQRWPVAAAWATSLSN